MVFAALFLESLGIPSPSELTLMAAGALAAEHQLSFAAVVLAGTSGSFLGAEVAYAIGRLGGRALVLRYGQRLGLNEERLHRVERFLVRYGIAAVIVGRVLSGVRAVISYPAGIFAMPWWAFSAATLVGSVLWPLLAGLLGQVLGREGHRLFRLLHHPWLTAVGLLVLLAGCLVVWRRRRRAEVIHR